MRDHHHARPTQSPHHCMYCTNIRHTTPRCMSATRENLVLKEAANKRSCSTSLGEVVRGGGERLLWRGTWSGAKGHRKLGKCNKKANCILDRLVVRKKRESSG